MFVRYLRFRFVSFTTFELLYAPRVPSWERVQVEGVWRNGMKATIAVGRGFPTRSGAKDARHCECNECLSVPLSEPGMERGRSFQASSQPLVSRRETEMGIAIAIGRGSGVLDDASRAGGWKPL